MGWGGGGCIVWWWWLLVVWDLMVAALCCLGLNIATWRGVVIVRSRGALTCRLCSTPGFPAHGGVGGGPPGRFQLPARPPPRGRRVAFSCRRPSPRLAMSFLCKALLELYAAGDLSATQVQELASAAWKDGWGQNDAFARRLAGLGASGKQPGNCCRDLMRAARNAGLLSSGAQPYEIDLPNNQGKLGIFLPHEAMTLMPDQEPKQRHV